MNIKNVLAAFMVLFTCFSFKIALAQTKELLVLDSLTKHPIASVSIFYEEDNNGTVTNENGFAAIGRTKSKTLKISHLNYQPKTISSNSFTNHKLTVYLAPLAANQLREVIISSTDIVGKWTCTLIANLRRDGSYHRVFPQGENANIKHYKSDGTFVITDGNGTQILLSGNYISLNNQVEEQIKFSATRALKNITNILYYSVTKNKKQMTVKYQLPGSTGVTEEKWSRL